MASDALRRWRTERAERLAELLDAHALIGGTGPGGRRRTGQLNAALVLRLAAEFQGFARELHDLGAATLASWAAGGNPDLQAILEERLTDGRLLDRRNAHPDSLAEDFGRFGFDLWAALGARSTASPARQGRLRSLNEARNAIAHDDETALAALRASGQPITLATIRAWRSALDGLAATLDGELSARLARLFGRPAPW